MLCYSHYRDVKIVQKLLLSKPTILKLMLRNNTRVPMSYNIIFIQKSRRKFILDNYHFNEKYVINLRYKYAANLVFTYLEPNIINGKSIYYCTFSDMCIILVFLCHQDWPLSSSRFTKVCREKFNWFIKNERQFEEKQKKNKLTIKECYLRTNSLYTFFLIKSLIMKKSIFKFKA